MNSTVFFRRGVDSDFIQHPSTVSSSLNLLLRGARWVGLCWLLSVVPIESLRGAAVTFESLLGEMVDLRGMAEWPKPAYTCRQFSSYDRKSKSPQEEWFANHDRGQYLREEEHENRREYVMMESVGPGAVVRIWSANPEGNLRVYLDGAEEPSLMAPMKELLGGDYPGVPRPLAGEYSKGWNLYLPIPYARHCKITSDQGDFYYHVNYRTYEPGTVVESFSLAGMGRAGQSLERLVERLKAPQVTAQRSSAGSSEPFELVLSAGETVQETLWGPSAICGVVLKVDAQDLEAALRGVVLKIAFDGEDTVQTPLGDFFGSAPGVNPFETLPLGMSESGELYSYWFMPFRRESVITLVNQSEETVAMRGAITLQPYTWTERSMHFHAKWRVEWDIPTRPMIDWNYLTARGQGVFAGVAFAIDNPVKAWWGEGDEKIYVDGETFPSHFGTGTEDYFGYAWCWPGLFTHAYHAQPRCTGPGNYGRTSLNRFHIIDRIPYARDFRFDMELWHWNDKCDVNLSVVAYWYALPGGEDEFAVIQPTDAIVRPMPEYEIPRVAGALEGESMRVVKVVGTVGPQDWDGLSAGRHLWWHAGMKPGDELQVLFDVPEAGKYRVIGHFLKARDYGIHQLAINGREARAPIDFFDTQVRPSGQLDLGQFELRQGGNRFSATVVGANPEAVKAYMLGLDYLLLQPVE